MFAFCVLLCLALFDMYNLSVVCLLFLLFRTVRVFLWFVACCALCLVPCVLGVVCWSLCAVCVYV